MWQVKSSIDESLNSAKDPAEDNFTQQMNIDEVLEELEISKDDYYRALPISKDEDSEMHLKRKLNPIFLIIILMLVRKLGRQMWTYSLCLMSISKIFYI